MGEDLANSTFDKYIPTDEELKKAGLYPELLDLILTTEEIEALTSRPDKGLIKPVPQYIPNDIEEFKNWQNNFHAFFRLRGGFDVGKRRFKVFQRLAVLEPQLVDRLISGMQEYENRSDVYAGFDDNLWQELYHAYQQMAGLVDANDRYVIEDGTNGEPDRYFLKR